MGYIDPSPFQAGGSSIDRWTLASDDADPWDAVATSIDPDGLKARFIDHHLRRYFWAAVAKTARDAERPHSAAPL